MDVLGWKLYNKVIIVEKENNRYDIPQGYIVGSNNKSQLNSALKWATQYNGDVDSYDEYLKSHSIELENTDFEVEIYSGPESSYQGGKLSFSNCVISKNNRKWLIGVDTVSLMSLIKQSTFVNGVCSTKVRFARCNGRVALIHENMQEYKDALNYVNKQQNINKGKTKKWEIGKTYDTLRESTLYLGKVNLLLDVNTKYGRVNYNKIYYNAATYTINKICKQVDLCINMHELRDLLKIDVNTKHIKLSKLVELIKTKNKELDDDLIYRMNLHTNTPYSWEKNRLENLFQCSCSDDNKIVARKPGEFYIDLDIDINEALNEIYNNLCKIYTEYPNLLSVYKIDLFGTKPLSVNSLTDCEILLMNVIAEKSVKLPDKVILKLEGDN